MILFLLIDADLLMGIEVCLYFFLSVLAGVRLEWDFTLEGRKIYGFFPPEAATVAACDWYFHCFCYFSNAFSLGRCEANMS